MGRRGPQPKWWRDTTTGEMIEGLIRRKDDRFTAHRTNKTFGTDPKLAVFRFRQWQASQSDQTIRILNDEKTTLAALEILASGQATEAIGLNVKPQTVYRVPKQAFNYAVHDAILTDTKLASQDFGISELANLAQLKPPQPSKSLRALIKLYLDDKKCKISPKEWANSRSWWSEFVKITGAREVADLNHRAFRSYRQAIEHRQDKLRLSNTWTRSRFGKIKTVINYAATEMDLSPDDRAILQLRSLLKPPSKPSPNPIDITEDELRAILEHADEWETALILTALNAAYYPVDCRRLQWSMIDWKKAVIRFDRTKATGRAKKSIPRVAVLWQRTVRALQNVRRTNHPHVFLSSQGSPVDNETIRNHWNKLCKRAGIQRRITFGNLRDSALTAAASSIDPVVPIQQYHVLGGHVALGVDDNYIRRNPRIVELACHAVENHYFGGKK